MRIVHVTSVHPWDDSRIFFKMCRSLAEAGFEVHLVVPRSQAPATERREGVVIHAVPVPRTRRQRILRTVPQVRRTAAALDGDIYHCHDPELAPVLLSLKGPGRSVVYDVHEDVPKDILLKQWIPRWLRPVASRLAALVLRQVGRRLDAVVAATPTIAGRFPNCRTAVIRNYPLLGELCDGDARPWSERPNLVAYIGGLTRARGIPQAAAAMQQLPGSLAARLALAGEFEDAALQAQILSGAAAGGVDFHGWLDRQGVKTLLARARVGLVALLPTPTYVDSLPIKLFEYMAAGIPVVASDFPLWRQIVSDAGCGLLVDPCEPREIARAVQWLLEHPDEAERLGRQGRNAVQRSLNWDGELKNLIDLYQAIRKDRAAGQPAAPAPAAGQRQAA
ncbi:MAG: glycosyltransferase family 4 protein [Candidatus Anammoximicrobium sp.]|nr:glycosyltransferase family 4 protein [Candidatus Anammoximicrobium sp.]